MIVYIAVVVLCVWLVYLGFGLVEQKQTDEHIQVAREAVVRSAVQCYALESRYPDSLNYLEANYGLVLDNAHFIYHYRVIGSNIMPEIQVFPKTSGGNDG